MTTDSFVARVTLSASVWAVAFVVGGLVSVGFGSGGMETGCRFGSFTSSSSRRFGRLCFIQLLSVLWPLFEALFWAVSSLLDVVSSLRLELLCKYNAELKNQFISMQLFAFLPSAEAIPVVVVPNFC